MIAFDTSLLVRIAVGDNREQKAAALADIAAYSARYESVISRSALTAREDRVIRATDPRDAS